MSAGRGTLRQIAHHLVGAVRPLETAFSDADAFRSLLFRLGWEVPGLPPSYLPVASAVTQAVDALDALADGAEIDEVIAVVQGVGTVYRAIDALSEAPAGIDPAEFLPAIARRLFEYLLARQLLAEAPGFYASAEALGIIVAEDCPATGSRPGFTRMRIDWNQIPEILGKPDGIPARVYGWGTPDLDFPKIADLLAQLFITMRLSTSVDQIDPDVATALQAGATGPPTRNPATGVSLALFEIDVGEIVEEVGVLFAELPGEGAALPGVIMLPEVPDGIDDSYDIGDSWAFRLKVGTDLAHQLGVIVRPGETGVRYPFQPGAVLPSAGFGFSIEYEASESALLFGEPTKTRLEIKKASFFSELNLTAGDLELKLGAAPEALALVVSPDDLDGFLGSAIGGKDLRIEFPLNASWSNRTGLSLLAGLGFEVSAYPHLNFGVVRFDRVDIGLRFIAASGDPAQIDLRVAAALSGEIGPIAYAVDRLGVHLPITLEPGNAGPVDIGFGLLRPNALGLVVDAGLVTGGGFIKLDPDKGRYFGMIELKMFEIGVTAMAILDTKDSAGNDLPSPGFSFFMVIAAELPPIQLGFGFTLNGVGGLIGINRRMNSDALLAGVREGVLDSIMFPKDPVANANTILSNLSTIFPLSMNRYVFGPMALIGWGTPTLVRIELAVVLEVPTPILLALLGKAAIAIPAEDTAIISINLDVVGILDFGRSTFAVDASLRDSYIAAFALSGDMAMRLSWGETRNFAMAVGGLNPHFTPPARFPSLRRITVALGMGENPRITLEGYFAVTSNSLQFGAKAELYASRAGFSIHGWVGFDALLIFQPLWFRIDFAAGMTLNRGSTRIAGITVRGSLTGPSPFHAWGEGCVSFLFFDVCVPFDETFGEERSYDLPDRDPWPALETAIKTSANWTPELGTDIIAAVSLRPPPVGSADFLLHPMAAATLRQKVLPFNRPLERFGEFEIVGPNQYNVSDVLASDDDTPPWTTVTDHFAPGDYEMLSETEKLSRDSFEEMDAGVRVGGGLVGHDPTTMKVANVIYETRIIEAGWKARVLPPFLLDRAVQVLAVLRSAKAGSPLRKSGRTRFAPDLPRASGVRLAPESFAVASRDALKPVPEVATATTRGAAHLAIKTKLGRSARGAELQVVPTHELEIAA